MNRTESSAADRGHRSRCRSSCACPRSCRRRAWPAPRSTGWWPSTRSRRRSSWPSAPSAGATTMCGSGRSGVPARRGDEFGSRPVDSRQSRLSVFVVARAPRERMTIDLRGLAPALKAHAKARHLTVSDAARLAVAAALETSPLDPEVEPADEPDAAADQPVKLTVRLRRGVAARLDHTRPSLRPLARHVPHHVDRWNAGAAARRGGGAERIHGSARGRLGRPERGHPPVPRQPRCRRRRSSTTSCKESSMACAGISIWRLAWWPSSGLRGRTRHAAPSPAAQASEADR